MLKTLNRTYFISDMGGTTRHESPVLKHIFLAGVAQWIKGWPAKQRFTGSIPSQDTCLGCSRGNYTLMILFLSFTVPSPLSKNKQNL